VPEETKPGAEDVEGADQALSVEPVMDHEWTLQELGQLVQGLVADMAEIKAELMEDGEE
jgi:hypothetical protein